MPDQHNLPEEAVEAVTVAFSGHRAEAEAAVRVAAPAIRAAAVNAYKKRLLSDDGRRIVHEAMQAGFGGKHSPERMLRRLAALDQEDDRG